MYNLYGFDESIRNIYLVSHPHIGEGKVKGTKDLRDPFREFLAGYHPGLPVNKGLDPFILDEAVEARLAAAYCGSLLNDLHQEQIIGDSYDAERRADKMALARGALAELLDEDPRLSALFDLAIHSIFISKTKVTPNGLGSHGGSASGSVGIIWLSMQDSLTEMDIKELFVHELTHHLLFIDELVHLHFEYEKMSREENFAFSAILNRIRPLDKVVHSIVVATEIVLARRSGLLDERAATTVHPSTDKMLRDVVQACDSVFALSNLDELLRPRGHELVERCRATCSSLIEATMLGEAS